MARKTAGHTAVRITAAVFGSLALAIAASICIGRVAPFSHSTRFAIAHYGFVPLWIAGACFGFTAKSGARAWAGYAALVVLFLVLARFGGRP
ncbi:hypothetical protein [Pendulispora albinea]|uniref:Uncharacterized protein n=1 Tax=Pendulispora albinea TaxID=2741071 RepID=A0ABZ2M6B1_9BACT